MPRTKQKKAKRTSLGAEHLIRDFNKLTQLRISRMELDFKSIEQRYEASLQMALNRYPLEIQNMTLNELLTIVKTPKKENIPPKTPQISRGSKNTTMKTSSKSSKPQRVTATSDDGYQSESTASRASKATAALTRRSRSSSQNRAQSKSQNASQISKSKLSRSQSASRDPRSKMNPVIVMNKKFDKESMRTPTNKGTSSFVITPKVKLNSAMNVLRKPKDGEMVFSTQGSPLLVSTTVSGRTANINVPLRNGKVVSLLPFHETSLSENLNLDEETKHQLKILQSHLAKVLD